MCSVERKQQNIFGKYYDRRISILECFCIHDTSKVFDQITALKVIKLHLKENFPEQWK